MAFYTLKLTLSKSEKKHFIVAKLIMVIAADVT